jgi:hypothetical protein
VKTYKNNALLDLLEAILGNVKSEFRDTSASEKTFNLKIKVLL